ncbi:ExbD/TolR family protein [Halomonas sp. WWR20]
MRFPRRQREPVEVNLTPLIDVVFLLLIFFMVSTTFETRQALELELPQASQGASASTPEPLVLTIDAEGDYRLDDEPLASQAALREALAPHADLARERGLVIAADGRAAHADVVAALDAAAALGIQHVRISTRQGNETPAQVETP